jgi:hypothetical protein
MLPATRDQRRHDPARGRCRLGALVLTVDTPVGGKRERNIRNGFGNIRGGLLQALSLKPSILIEAMTHPGWIVEYLKRGGGTPMLGNWQPYAPPGSDAEEFTNSPRRCGRSMRRPGATSRPTRKLFPARSDNQGRDEPGRRASRD